MVCVFQWWVFLLILSGLIVSSRANCGQELYASHNMIFNSPNYPNDYKPFTDCTWTIRLNYYSRSLVMMRFDAFELEFDELCRFDFLEIRDGKSDNSPLIGKYCGSTLPPFIKSNSNSLRIRFKTNGQHEMKGFAAHFETAYPHCPDDQFKCPEDERSISTSKLCDGLMDCSKGSDETNCSSCQMSDLLSPNAVFTNCREETASNHLETVNVTCRQGYTLDSEPSVRCVNSSWSDIPKCIPSCSFPTKLPKNVQVISLYAAKFLKEEKAFLKCSGGYFVSEGLISSQMMITCKGNDMWAPTHIHCHPKEHFPHTYKPHTEKIVFAAVGDTLELSCSLAQITPKEVGISFSWFKNGINLENLSNESFVVTTEGNLIVQNFSSENSGTYTCLKKNQSLYLDTSNETYIVKGKPACLPFSWNSTITVHQNTSVFMVCPYTDFQFFDSPVWININGERIFNDDRFSLVSNFGLLLKSVHYLDQGMYICDLGPNTPFCERKFPTNLQVIPTNDGICGLTPQSGGFPWLVTLWWDDEIAPFCYGALVNERWVVTAASCLIGLHRKRNPGVSVKLGQQNSYDTTETSTEISVEYAKIHPQYSRRVHKADIGIVKLKKPITYSSDIIPICLSGDNFKPQPNEATCEPLPPLIGNVSGLGSLEADLISPESECMLVPAETPCPTTPEGISCAQGCADTSKYVSDTGSPFQVMKNGKVYLYGIFSWGERRAKETEFDYFTVVSPYYKWIASFTQRRD